MTKQYIKIKEFSNLTGVSVRALQYYDEINLLTPAYTNEQGHRFYDASSFSKIFVIISLKTIGMNLSSINQYLNNSDFDINLFIQEEKRRVETAITDLQLRLMRLNDLDELASKTTDISPYILPFFPQITKSQIEKLVPKQHFTFDIKGWTTFIKNLNFCLENELTSKDDKAMQCIQYWQENIIKANQVSEDIIKFAEDYYQQNPSNTFGITAENYNYLMRLIDEL